MSFVQQKRFVSFYSKENRDDKEDKNAYFRYKNWYSTYWPEYRESSIGRRLSIVKFFLCFWFMVFIVKTRDLTRAVWGLHVASTIRLPTIGLICLTHLPHEVPSRAAAARAWASNAGW